MAPDAIRYTRIPLNQESDEIPALGFHTPFAFAPGDEQDPRDANDRVIYGVRLLGTWGVMERLVDAGKCRAIGLSVDAGVPGFIPRGR